MPTARKPTKRGAGSIRERPPGVWEIRVVVGHDAVRSRSVQRSFTVHGDAAFAEQRRRELVDDYGVTRIASSIVGARLIVGELMELFFAALHLWKPATVVSHRPVVQALVADPLARRRLVVLTAGDVRAAILRWQANDVSVPTVSARWLVLRSALSWAVGEGTLRTNPLTGMKGPPRPAPREHHPVDEVRRLLRCAEAAVGRLEAELVTAPTSARWRRLLFSAEQTLLLVPGGRLGRPAGRAGRPTPLGSAGTVLTIERGLSCGVLGSTKSSRRRRLTLGTTTVGLIERHFSTWAERGSPPVGDWLFSPTPERSTFVTAGAPSHKFRRLGEEAAVEGPALHRLRHGVATHLVRQGKLLDAQARLGHRDPATTLRHYAHAVPLDDEEVAEDRCPPQRTVLRSDVLATRMLPTFGLLTSQPLTSRRGIGCTLDEDGPQARWIRLSGSSDQAALRRKARPMSGAHRQTKEVMVSSSSTASTMTMPSCASRLLPATTADERRR